MRVDIEGFIFHRQFSLSQESHLSLIDLSLLFPLCALPLQPLEHIPRSLNRLLNHFFSVGRANKRSLKL